MKPDMLRLTHAVASAGCAAKIGAGRLREVLSGLNLDPDDRLLVGIATGDDAGVVRLPGGGAIVQTLDFFPPVVDDPYTFGQIAAANALSDVYAMGGTPLTAMNIVCYPIQERDGEELLQILKGGADKVKEAGAMLVGGHSVDDPQPKFGLSVTGLIDPNNVASNAGAQPGDVIVLTKALGAGIVTTAAKFDDCPEATYQEAARSMATLNRAAAEAMCAVGIDAEGVHACTDITGFGLTGHLLHLCQASGVGIRLFAESLPAFEGVEALAEAGNTPGGLHRNEAYVQANVEVKAHIRQGRSAILYDPQTSGGLAIVVSPDKKDALLIELEKRGVTCRAIIGEVVSGEPRIEVV
jgi:selenide,water dikinase